MLMTRAYSQQTKRIEVITGIPIFIYGTAQFKLYTCVQAHTCACKFNASKTSKTGVYMQCCTRFGVRMRATEHTRDSRHELTLGLPHYTCGVATGTVAVGTEMQLIGFLHVVMSIA